MLRARLAASGDLDAAAQAARAIDGVVHAAGADGVIELLAVEASPLLPRLLATVADAGAVVKGVEVDEPDLEAVFLHLTGKALRD